MPGDACECPFRGHYDDGDVACEQVHEDTGLMCSRPEGHDGAHAACSVQEHPAMVWMDEEVA